MDLYDVCLFDLLIPTLRLDAYKVPFWVSDYKLVQPS